MKNKYLASFPSIELVDLLFFKRIKVNESDYDYSQCLCHVASHPLILLEFYPVADDLDVSPDLFEYFLGTYPILRRDKSLWCVSAWNDNGKTGLVDESAPELLYRTDFFPGLGWMLTKDVWAELAVKWPAS